jgi:hypothetical protein
VYFDWLEICLRYATLLEYPMQGWHLCDLHDHHYQHGDVGVVGMGEL